MNFKDTLNKYLKICNCSSKELSKKSSISEAVISRYRSGERTPKIDSIQLKKISNSIEDIIKEKDITNYININIYNELSKAIKEKDKFNYDNFSTNLNKLITSLKININEMSKYIVFDPSHISRIRYGKTKPSDPVSFCEKVSFFVVSKYNNIDKYYLFTSLGISITKKINNNEMFKIIFDFLTNSPPSYDNNIKNFLINLDKFNLSDYIKAISFDKLKVPNIPFYKARSKNYFGLEEMKKGELDFFKATVLSKSNENIFMCSDMPMEDMARDIEFGKKWMFGVAMCLKKGLHLNIIHNLDRPFNEMMLGLESWMPIYMTGQISPYYLKEVKNSVYQHLNYVSGEYALTGECIKGYHNKGKYYLINNSKEINYYKEKAKQLLKKAYPLMDIYNEKNRKLFESFQKEDLSNKLNRKRYLYSLPIFTITDELLIKILNRNNLSKKEKELIIEYKHKEEKKVKNILETNTFQDYIYKYNKDDNIYLSLEGIPLDKRINYTYDEYQKHLDLTLSYNNPNYNVIFNKHKVFDNIVIEIVMNKYVIIYKVLNPAIYFVIKHPKLVSAINNFNPLVIEKN